MKKLLVILIPFLFPLISFSTIYYVSNSGSDGANGTSPGTSWKTISKVNSMMSSFASGDVIRFNRGDVWIESLLIGKSGVSGNPIRFATYGSGANPKFSGFQTISAWSSIATNLWLSSAAATTLATLNMVTVGGNFTPIGRWPDATYSDIVSAVGNTSLTGAGVPAGVSGGQVVIRKNHWIIDKSTISSQSGNILNFLSPNNYPITVGCFGTSCWGFLVQNCQAVCTAQNEWWFDAGTKKIGMFSIGTPPATKVAAIDVILNVGIFSFVRFDSLDFEGSNSYTVNVTSGNNIDFENCNFSFNGINCFNVQSAAHHITINNSTLERTNNNGIAGGGSANWTITNNLFHNTAQVPGMGLSSDGNYIGMYNMGPNSLIQYNRIIKTGYSGIDFRGNSNQILNNLVDTFCNVKDDGAGIYTYTGVTAAVYTQRYVQNNIIVNGGNASNGTSTTNGDASGIYMDANSSQVTISGNTIGNCDGVGIFLNGDHDLTINDNTIYNCPRTGGYGAILEIYPTVDATLAVRNLVFTRNKIVTRATNQIVGYLKTDEVDMKSWGRWDSNYYCRPINDLTATNTFTLINNGSTQITNLTGWKAKAPSGEVHSKISPVNISNLADLRFDYNATNAPVVVSLGGFSYIDMTGVSYPGSITLSAYSSAVLIKQGVSNSLPVVTAGPDQTITLPTASVTMAGNATDADGTIASHTWTRISGPAATITTPSSYTTTITGLTQGTYVFQLSATDNSGGVNTDVMQVIVNQAANILPVANAGADKVITLPTNTVTQIGSGTDADGTISSYLWTQVSGPSTATIASASSSSSAFNNLIAGVYVFNLRVTDNRAGIANDQFQITVNNPANIPPVANAGTDQTIQLPTSSTTLNGSATDADGSVASHTWSFVLGPTTPVISTPSSYTSSVSGMTLAGTYTFRLTAVDNLGASGSDIMVILVNPAANVAPTSNAGVDKTITLPTTTTSVTGVASSDPDGTIVAYLWTQVSGPSTATIVSSAQQATNINNLSVAGTYVFNLRVTDNSGANSNDQMQVIVNQAINQLPTANAGTDKNITLPTNSVSQVGSGTDPDGTISSYAWTKTSGPATFTIVSPTASTTTINNLVAGTYVFQLQVTDNRGGTATDVATIIVNPVPNVPPTANAGTNQTITLPTNSVTLIGSGNDPDGTITAYLWTKTAGPGTFTIVSPTSSTTAVNNLVAGTYTFQLQVTDNSSATATNTVQVVVNPAPPPNQSPVSDAGTDKNITLPTNSISQVGSGTDPDGSIASYLWTKLSGPSTFTIVSATSATTVINNLVAGTYTFQLQVTDNLGATDVDQMTVIVNPAPNIPPQADAGTNKSITLPTNSVTQVGSGSDADGSIASYAWTKISGPSTFTIVSPTSATTAINNLIAGTYVFRLTVTDNQSATGSDDVTILVNAAPNIPPVTNAGADQTIQLPTTSTTLAGNATDADGTISSHTWTLLSGAPAVATITTPSSYTSTVTGLTVAGTYSLKLAATDNSGATTNDTMAIRVNPVPNIPPISNAGPDITDTLPNDAQLSGNGTDADGSIISYLWSIVSGPNIPTFVSATQKNTAVTNLIPGTYTIRLRVTDNSGAAAFDTMTLSVDQQPIPQPTGPIADAGPNKKATICLFFCTTTSVSLVGIGTAGTYPIASYHWDKLSGPVLGNIISPDASTTLINNLVRGNYTFQLTVTDEFDRSSTDTVTVIVTKQHFFIQKGKIVVKDY
jgi:parallel beta-helix repeat protein